MIHINFQVINILSVLVKIASQTIAHFKSENLKRKPSSLTMITFASEHIFDYKVRRQETSYRLLFERRTGQQRTCFKYVIFVSSTSNFQLNFMFISGLRKTSTILRQAAAR